MSQSAQPGLLLLVLLTGCQSSAPSNQEPNLAWGSPWRVEELRLASAQLLTLEAGQQSTAELRSSEPFDRLLASWNALPPTDGSFVVELRVGDDASWSPWLWLADWGLTASGPGELPRSSDEGYVDVDMFVAKRPLSRFQLRISGLDPLGQAADVALTRLDFCLRAARTQDAPVASPVPAARTPLAVPALSQREAAASIAARICSPTSLAMVLAFYAHAEPPESVAARAYDPWHDVYGNWPRAIQCAWSFGVPGYLTFLNRWESLEALVQAGRPVVISIRVQPGELSGAPYDSTPGHLLVVVGFDGQGGVIVNDPAAATRAEVQRVYAREQLGRAWFGHGGLAYVF